MTKIHATRVLVRRNPAVVRPALNLFIESSEILFILIVSRVAGCNCVEDEVFARSSCDFHFCLHK